jgi:hypothetical protein
MNLLRRCRTLHATSPWITHLILLVLALRLLFPTGLMLDMSAEGDVAGIGGTLVICSGHGALVIPNLVSGTAQDLSIEGKVIDSFEHTALPRDDGHAALPGSDTNHAGNAASNEICPFSAAFVNALVAFAIVLVFCHFFTLSVAHYWRQRFSFIQRFFRCAHSPRGPPQFA